jgi:hypothetical protein
MRLDVIEGYGSGQWRSATLLYWPAIDELERPSREVLARERVLRTAGSLAGSSDADAQ